MKKVYMVKYKTKQGGSGSAVTTQISANTLAEAKQEIKKKQPGCTIVSVTEK